MNIWKALVIFTSLASTSPVVAQEFSLNEGPTGLEHLNLRVELVREAMTLLLKGAEGEAELRKRVVQSSGDIRKAACIALVYSGDSKHVRLLLSLLRDKDLWMRAVSAETVSLYPKESWPILNQMANEGCGPAVGQISRYTNLRKPVLHRLTKSQFAEVRMWAITCLNSPDAYRKGLHDPDWNVCRAAVQGAMWSPGIDRMELYKHKLGRVRAFAAEFTQRWTEKNISFWSEMAKDPNPYVRYWAMYQIAPIAMYWCKTDARLSAIAAVQQGIADGPSMVREAATHAVRCWLLGWNWALKNWTREEIAAARSVLSMQKLRNELYGQALREARYNQVAWRYDVQKVIAMKALALSGDPRERVSS